ncbi:hypothetical protein [Nocardia cyriacigeorgica]|uniref:hypothetical protein n=1 Tax=Nocardia cyriacigeorgica TaxID=135487 RepID=UPI00189537FE|nr:hypothetical protein [Nocardia cyriacigeorgica]MBF6414623.1 hypothetical protein [Nocardia cyriacigeorgica]
MSDSPVDMSLLTRSRRLAFLAGMRREGAEKRQDVERTNTALEELAKELTALDASLKLHAFLVGRGIAAEIEIDFGRAPRVLRNHIDQVGRPSPQFLKARTKDARKAREELDASAANSWAQWSQETLGELPLSRIALLDARRVLVETDVRDMKLVAGKPPTIASVEMFLSKYASVKERFDSLGPTAEVDTVLAKLPCRLSDLSDEDIALLRSHDVDPQISLRTG